MKKIQFQLTCSVSRPPTSGPIASAIAGHAGPDADRLAALARRERRRDDRERRRVHQRAAEALHDARADQEAAVRRETAREARPGEDDEADHEDQPAADVVGELAAREHERGERQRVAGDHPLELRQRHVQRAPHRRQRHVHDGVVEHDHEQPDRHRGERPPLLVLRRHETRSHPITFPSKLVRAKLADANPGAPVRLRAWRRWSGGPTRRRSSMRTRRGCCAGPARELGRAAAPLVAGARVVLAALHRGHGARVLDAVGAGRRRLARPAVGDLVRRLDGLDRPQLRPPLGRAPPGGDRRGRARRGRLAPRR